MRTELISIPTPTHPLDAAYYTPDGPIKGAAVYCHGNQMNFYVCAARFLAPYLTSLGYVFMPFNRRGHDSVSTYDSRECVGGAYQTVAEGIETEDQLQLLQDLKCDFGQGYLFSKPLPKDEVENLLYKKTDWMPHTEEHFEDDLMQDITEDNAHIF